jgi:hypothetical protein
MRNNELHDLNLIKIIVARSVGTGAFLDIPTAIRNKRFANQRRLTVIFNKTLIL